MPDSPGAYQPGQGVLVTRPEPGLHETMRTVAGLGLLPLACPMLRIAPRRPALPQLARLDAIVLTSGQSVEPLARTAAAQPSLFKIPVLAVGDRTAQRARDAGFVEVRSAQGDAGALVALVDAGVPPGASILLASGARQGLGLAASLRAGGRIVHRRVVYAAAPIPTLRGEAQAALAAGTVCAGLFFSAETAASFATRCPASLLSSLSAVDALAIGHAAATVLGALPWRTVRVAARPQADALLELLQHAAPTIRTNP